ncbi:CRISPR-associated protein, Csx7 family [Rivularia sp. PCC 7116]|uniref:type III CRISPR-associated RAMP protein Csx7 n=1 Tax=Rivularia sp. PCC 7116 TaxID=373994 RepID=UPI00029ECDDC|nr:CRISPR-associated RAMP protein Csx7 [Rivularia sp. PCC 7116]AFY55874.1 CRISPR-associated protein, Csx7 family [Rivularia sp. PCC 7116]
MFDKFKNRLELTGILTTVTALRISAGRSSEPIGSDLPVVKDALNQPLIPGASFKGAMRSRLESFLRGINQNWAEDPAEFTSKARNETIKGLKEKYKEDDKALTNAILNQTDLVSRLFGSPWIASKFQVRDLTVVKDTWFNQYQERDGVAIERDTETAGSGKLYDFQVVPAGTEFDFKAVVENSESWERGLLMIGLHQFESEQITLGGGSSRGLGVVSLELNKMQWFDSEGDAKKLLEYMENQVNQTMGDYQYSTQEDIDILKREWSEHLINHLYTELDKAVVKQPSN